MKKVRYIVIGLIIGLIVGIAVGYGISASSAPKTAQTASSTAVKQPTPDVYGLWSLTNTDRQNAGLPQLALDARLNASAAAKCHDMDASDYWAHNSPNGATPWSFIKTYYGTYVAAGENLSDGFHTNADVNAAWMNSTEHKANILNPRYTDVGYAVCDVTGVDIPGESILVVQHFASK